MVVHALQIKATLENVEELRFPEDHDWTLDLEKGNEIVKKEVIVNRGDTAPVEGSKGDANLVLPSLKANISIQDTLHKEVDGTYLAQDSGKWKTVMVMEARGVNIAEWHLTGPYKVISGNDGDRQTWADVSLNDEWMEVNEKTSAPVRIHEIETQVVVYKK